MKRSPIRILAWGITAVSAVVVAVIFQPMRTWLKAIVDKRFYPEKEDLASGLVEALPEHWAFLNDRKLFQIVQAHVSRALGVDFTAVYLVVGDSDYKLVQDGKTSQGIPILLRLSSCQEAELRRRRVEANDDSGPAAGYVPIFDHVRAVLGVPFTAFYLAEQEGGFKLVETGDTSPGVPSRIKPTASQVDELIRKRVVAAEVSGHAIGYVPIHLDRRRTAELLGLMAIGKRTNGRGYSGDELKALADLGGKIGLAMRAIELAEARARSRTGVTGILARA